jgi:hypothetical protein
MTLIIRFNEAYNNMSLSDGAIMYTKKLNGPSYYDLHVGSGKKFSGIHLYSGLLSRIPEILEEADEKQRFKNPCNYDNIPVYKFSINITESPNIDIKNTAEWTYIKSIVYPRII